MKNILNRVCMCAICTCLLSCSVKEDRAPCPCFVSLDMTECVGAGELIITVWNDGMVYKQYSSPAAGKDVIECEIPKGVVTVSAISARSGAHLTGNLLEIPQGASPDSVYACARRVDASGENAWGRMKLSKQFASVSLDTRETLYLGEEGCLEVRINVCGMDIRDLSAVSGDLVYTVYVSEDGIFRFCLPRIPDGRVELAIGKQGDLRYPLDLGAIMRRSGYDWDAADLSDINIRTGPSEGDLRFEIIPWRGFRMEDVVI